MMIKLMQSRPENIMKSKVMRKTKQLTSTIFLNVKSSEKISTRLVLKISHNTGTCLL